MGILSASCSRFGKEPEGLVWVDLPPIPAVKGKVAQPGLAGPVAGASGQYLMVAGGANFEDEMPWRGGAKSYHDEIFLLEKRTNGRFSWKQSPEILPRPLAYPACVNTPDGIVSIGGENGEGPVSDVFRFSLVGGEVRIESLPVLPLPLSSPGAALAGRKIYLAGGLDREGASDACLVLDLDDLQPGWKRLPGLPVPVSHSMVVTQYDGSENCLYVFGGRNKTSDIHTFFSSVWKFIPSRSVWEKEGSICSEGAEQVLAAGTGVPAGSHHILLFGGDPGIFFNLTERLNNAIALAGDSVREILLAGKESMLTHHPGFSRKVLAYDTVHKSWCDMATAEKPVPATTVAFFWEGMIIIPSGEVRPGVRTPALLAAEIKLNGQ